MRFIQDFKDATIGFSGYVRLARNRSGAFGYIALLLAVVLTISAVITVVNLKRSIESVVADLQAGPDFQLKEGKFSFSGPMPYRLGHPGEGEVIIDTTGQTTRESLVGARPNTILITEDAYHSVSPFGQISSQEFKLLPITMTKADVVGFVRALPTMTAFGYLFVYVAQLGFKALDAVILGVIALLYGSATRRKISFDLGFRLGLYAMTMPILIQWLLPGFTTLTRWGFAIWWGLAILYLLFGLRAYLTEEEQTVGPR